MKSLPLIALILAGATGGRAQIAASYLPSSHFLSAFTGGGFGVSGQTFTSTASGTLGSVGVLADAFTPVGPITVQFQSTAAGLPNGILGSVVVDGSGLGSDSPLTADFADQNITLTAGDVYAFDFLSSQIFGLEGTDDAYAGGEQLVSGDGVNYTAFPPPRDLYFSVSLATPVPEPAAFGLYGAVMAIVLTGSRKRTKRQAK